MDDIWQTYNIFYKALWLTQFMSCQVLLAALF